MMVTGLRREMLNLPDTQIMIHPVTIEVEMKDYDGQRVADIPEDVSLFQSLQVLLDEQMGGMLCMGHYHIPEFKTLFSRGRWVVQISCCCACQMQALEQRLQEIFPY
jgi:hypothetical protein